MFVNRPGYFPLERALPGAIGFLECYGSYRELDAFLVILDGLAWHDEFPVRGDKPYVSAPFDLVRKRNVYVNLMVHAVDAFDTVAGKIHVETAPTPSGPYFVPVGGGLGGGTMIVDQGGIRPGKVVRAPLQNVGLFRFVRARYTPTRPVARGFGGTLFFGENA